MLKKPEDYISYHTSEPEDRVIIKSNYIDEDISLQTFLIRKRLNLDRINKKFLNMDAKHPDFWNEFYYPCVIYKLRNKVMIDEKTEIEKDRFVEPIFELHYDFDLNYNNGNDIGFQVKKFHVSTTILMNRKKNERPLVSLMEYIENEDYPEHPLNLYKAIKYYIANHVDCDDWIVTGMALWAFGTHIYSIFEAYAYLYFLANRGSGKSRALRTLSYISRSGIMFVAPTLSSLFRTIDSLTPTVFLDETEYMRQREQAELINFLNASFQKGSVVPRTDIERKIIEYFEGYCPKAIASTKAIHPTLESRSLFLPIQRTLNLKKYATNEPDKTHGDELNLRMMFWALDSGSEIYDNARQNKLPPQYLELMDLATPRIQQLLKPLLYIASQLQLHELENEFEHLKKFIEYQNQHAMSESVDSADQRIIVALYRIVGGDSEKTEEIGSKEIIAMLGLESEMERKYFTPIRIGFILKRFGIQKRDLNGRKRYIVNSAKLTEILQRYNIAIDNLEKPPEPDDNKKSSIESYNNNKNSQKGDENP